MPWFKCSRVFLGTSLFLFSGITCTCSSFGFPLPRATVVAAKTPLASLFASYQNDNETTTCTEPQSTTTTTTTTTTNRRHFFQQVTTMATSFIAGKSIVSSSAVAVAAASPSFLVPTPAFSSDQYWPLGKIAFSLLPLAGGTRRATVEQCIVPNTMWTFDQIQGIVNVNVPVRSTVIALQQGGLWIHNPVAPTQEFLTRIQELQQQYGPVKHIVLGTVALEHKATLGAFARNFPEAIVWVQPGQWSFPLPFPLELLGVSQRKNKGTLRELVPQEQYTTNPPEWINEIDYEILGPLKFQSVGAFSETAFFHKPTQSLLVTDVVISVTEEPPAIIQEDPRALLFHSRDSAGDDTLLQTGDTPQLRRKGWRRMVQFGLIFFPSQINVPSLRQDIRDEQIVPPPLRNLGQAAVPFNLYPWTWNDDNDVDNFRAISNNGAMFCPPILTKLILDREPQRTLAWVDRVCERFRDMKRVVPCHLNNDIQVTSAKEFSQAFNSLRCSSSTTITGRGPLREDLRLLQNASDLLTQLQVVAPTQVECRQ